MTETLQQDREKLEMEVEADRSKRNSAARDEIELKSRADQESVEAEQFRLESQAGEAEEIERMIKVDQESWAVRAFEKARQAEELDQMNKADEENLVNEAVYRRDDALKAEVASMIPRCVEDRFHFWYDALYEISKGDDCEDEWPVILEDGITRMQSFDARVTTVIEELEIYDPQWEILHIGYCSDTSTSRPLMLNARCDKETSTLQHVVLPLCINCVQGIVINGMNAATRILGVLRLSLQASGAVSKVDKMLSGISHHLRVYMSSEQLVRSRLPTTASNAQLVRQQILNMGKAVRTKMSLGIVGRFDILRDALCKIIQDCEESEPGVYFVAEDDVCYVEDFSSRLDAVVLDLFASDPHWDVVQVGFSPKGRAARHVLVSSPEGVKQSSCIVRPMSACTPVGCAGFVVHGQTGARRMLSMLTDASYSLHLEDSFDFMYRKLRMYMSAESLLKVASEFDHIDSIMESGNVVSPIVRNHLAAPASFHVFHIDVSGECAFDTSLHDSQTLHSALERIASEDCDSDPYLVVQGNLRWTNLSSFQTSLQELQRHDPSWDALQVAPSDVSKVRVRPVQVEVSKRGARRQLAYSGRPVLGTRRFEGGFGALIVHGRVGATHLLRVLLDSSPCDIGAALHGFYTKLNVYVSFQHLALDQKSSPKTHLDALGVNAANFLQDPDILDTSLMLEEDIFRKLPHIRFQHSLYRLDHVDAATAPGAMGIFARLEGALREIVNEDAESAEEWYLLADGDPVDERSFLPDLTASLMELQGYDDRWDILMIGFSAAECQLSRLACISHDGTTRDLQFVAKPVGSFNLTGLVLHGAWCAQRLLNLLELHPVEEGAPLSRFATTLHHYVTTKPLIRGATSQHRRDASHHQYRVGEEDLLDDLRDHARARNLGQLRTDKPRRDRVDLLAERRYQRQAAPPGNADAQS